MSDLKVVLEELVKVILWPEFKRLGYKKSGNNFRYYNEAGWGRIVQIQKSSYNSAVEVQFTINVGFYLPEVERFICNTESDWRFQESACVIRKRIANLKGSQQAEWYNLTTNSEPRLFFTQVANDFTNYVHPYLSTVNSREDIYSILVNGHKSDYPAAQIQAMYQAGYKEAATRLFSSEIMRSKSNEYYGATLRRLGEALKLPNETRAVG